MKDHRKKEIRRRLASILPLLVVSYFVSLWSNSTGNIAATASGSSQQTLARRWDPTRVPAGVNLVGDQACAECHESKVTSHRKTAMAMAMEPVEDSVVLSTHTRLTFQRANYSYAITRKDRQSFYSVTDGKETISLPIQFAFGHGKAGQTYVLQYEGVFYESLVSYYSELKGLDFTVGASRGVPISLREALGRRLSKGEMLNCFRCHSTGGVIGSQLQLDKLTPGIRCEGCHGPGGEHIAAGKAGKPGANLIFNPARLSGDELTQEFCASCHRGTEEFSLLKSMAINNVRFQPYRIFQSKCYSDDKRISCTACHNPHEPLKLNAGYYDAKCLACHSVSPKTAPTGRRPADHMVKGCRVGTRNCASCHMPKVDPPEAHFKFTDHFIRIVRPNEGYRN
jgi:hypothetical protein